MPVNLGGLALVDTSTFESPNSGIMYRYRDSTGFQADVYRYPVTDALAPCTGKCLTEAAAREIETYRKLVPELIRRGIVDSVQFLREEPLAPRGTSWLSPGWHATFRIFRQGKELESHFVVLAGQETLVKLRASYPPQAFSAARLNQFIESLLDLAPPQYACPEGPSTADGITMSAAFTAADHDLPARIDSSLAALGYQVEYRTLDDTDGRWRTAPRFDLTEGVDAAGTPNPGVVLYVATQIRGDSVYYQTRAQLLCAFPSDQKNGTAEGNVVQMIAAMTLTSSATSDSTAPARAEH